MSNKFKLCYMLWEEKLNCYILPDHLYANFEAVDNEIIEAAEALNGLLTGIEYSSQKDKIVTCFENFCTLNGYTYTLESQVGDVLDEPFYKAVNRAAQYLSEIRPDDFETDNNLGVKVEQSYSSRGYTAKVQSEKDKLTFADFIGGGVGEGGSLKTVNCVEEFAKLFKDDYNNNKEQMEKLFGEAESVDDMLDKIESFGEFEHDLDTPLLNFVSGALDITIVKPLIEASIGRDLITGERLTDLERGFKAGGAVIDIFTLGKGSAVLRLGEMGFKQAVKVGGRYVVISACGDLAGYTAGYVSNDLDLPPAVTIVLSLSANAGVSWKLAGKSYGQLAENVKVKDLPEYEDVASYSTAKWKDYFNNKYGAENVELCTSKWTMDSVDDVSDASRKSADAIMKASESSKYSLPQGIAQEQFSNTSKLLRDRVGDISDDIVVQGSRAKGTAKPTSDIDIALRVSSDKFDSLINKYFKTPNPGSAKERTMLHAIKTGKIQSGEAKLKGLRLELEEIFGMDVDISIIKIDGPFDNPPFIPFE